MLGGGGKDWQSITCCSFIIITFGVHAPNSNGTQFVCACAHAWDGGGVGFLHEITSCNNLHDSMSYYVKITKEHFKHLE